jgi:hypothetical protein
MRPLITLPENWRVNMKTQSKKLVLSKETLRSLDDQDLSSVVGGTGTIVCVDTVLCNSGVCDSVICNSAVCNIGITL